MNDYTYLRYLINTALDSLTKIETLENNLFKVLFFKKEIIDTFSGLVFRLEELIYEISLQNEIISEVAFFEEDRDILEEFDEVLEDNFHYEESLRLGIEE